MPICDRKCNNCGHYEEDLIESRASFDNKVIECPICHQEAFEKPDHMPLGFVRMALSEMWKQAENGE